MQRYSNKIISFIITLLICSNISVAQNNKSNDTTNNEPDAIINDSTNNGAPLIVFNDTLFYFKTRVGSFTPNDRARIAAKRIKELADEFNYNPKNLKIIADGESYDIVYNETILVAINKEEAIEHNATPLDVSIKLRNNIITVIDKH